MRSCKVYVHGIEAGVLLEHDSPREYVFKYSPRYVARHKEPVCLAMPVRREQYRSPVLFPYFFNMLSEGSNRAFQASYHHLDKDDDFGILLATAHFDTPGCVYIRPINDGR